MHPFPRLSITQRLKNVGAKGAKTLDIYVPVLKHNNII
jgi:hypothetical protein